MYLTLRSTDKHWQSETNVQHGLTEDDYKRFGIKQTLSPFIPLGKHLG